MIGGRLAGVITMQSSGEPGKNISNFWIRGISTFGASSGAFVLIDGIEGRLEDIDPDDVKSFSILKTPPPPQCMVPEVPMAWSWLPLNVEKQANLPSQDEQH